jgi:hypothetical protein
MERVKWPKPGYASIICSTISNINYNLVFTTKFNDSSILSSTLEVASEGDGLPVGVIWVATSHDHVIAAKGFPPWMTHVNVTLLPSLIGPFGGWNPRVDRQK